MSRSLFYSENAQRILAAHLPVIVYDVETTGLSAAEDRITQFSGITYEWKDGEYVQSESFEQYIRPPFPVPPFVSELTGITDEFLEDKPEEKDVCGDVFLYLNRRAVFVGYNNSFDDKMISAMTRRCMGKSFEPAIRIDVMKVAKELIRAEDLASSSYKLCNVADYYKVVKEGFHNASVDIINTWRVLMAQMQDLEEQKKDASQGVSSGEHPFRLFAMTRWKKVFSKDQRYDRFYLTTSLGEYVYDVLLNSLKAKEKGSPELDATKMVMEMNRMAVENGYTDYLAVHERIEKI